MENSVSISNQDSTSNDLSYLRLHNGLFRHIWSADYSAPVHEVLQKGGAKVLDVGCGPGVWVMEMSKDYPSCNFIGIDSLSIHPQDPKDLTPNSKFLQVNSLLDPLPFEDNCFDYVHCRNANMDFSTFQWKDQIIPEMIRITKPDGFVEHCEVDEHHVNEGPIMRKITDSITNYNVSREIDGMIGEKLDEILLKTGLLYNIHHQQKYSPLGNWGGEYGKMAIDIFAAKCRTLRNQLAEEMKITPQEFDEKIENCLIEAENTRTYLKSHRIYAQKLT
ncbi:S-adenosyl-L-methionine-dependent methyltransferase [Glomus cerebriforme]|uniref:S-adenosyl-L-methionine-dependent methyltransferase n=1 Tax=Glomus cerebriforme TaxID=658196 RepID=A0A397TM12_9GLOM|nr:S-adenosyl-L-methionine-dependent methyltransferase [Glomus cerebriforme]